jgi:phosphoserine phosphatase
MTIMVRCVVETRDAKHAQELFQHLTDAGHVINFATSSLHILTKEQQEQHMQQKIGMEEIQKKQLSSQVVSVIGDTVEVLPEIQQASEETIDNKHEKN